MQAYEFSSIVEDNGIIHIPTQYLKNISSPVKVILLTSEKTQATIKLITELAKGKKAGEEQGWLSVEDVKQNLGITHA